MADWSKIDLFSSKNQKYYPKHKIPKNRWEKLNRFHFVKFQNFDFLKRPYFCRIASGQICHMSATFFLTKSLQKIVLMFMRNYKEIPLLEIA